jgi:hypothetical protein
MTKAKNNRIDMLINRRNAQFQRKMNQAFEIQNKYNAIIEKELKKRRCK